MMFELSKDDCIGWNEEIWTGRGEAWRLKLSSTFVYGASSTYVHATAKMRTSRTKDIINVGRVDQVDQGKVELT